jgi:hypothetical protein
MELTMVTSLPLEERVRLSLPVPMYPFRRGNMRRLVLGFAIVLTLLAVIGTATNFGWVPFLFLPTIGATLR